LDRTASDIVSRIRKDLSPKNRRLGQIQHRFEVALVAASG